MADVEDIIIYIKSLKKGFDKDLFQNKVDELGYLVENTGLNYDDFHTLFKVWLNLSIPITKWVNLGACLVPQEKVCQSTIEYSLRWILANYENQSNFSRIGFLLDWLTAAMDCDSIEMEALDVGYELFYTILTFETLTVHAMKLVYTLTKPADVTRRRVLELLDYAKVREGKKNMYRQIQVLLGLFKSFKPEYVPEDVPSISIYTAFRKINTTLLQRFRHSQSQRNSLNNDTYRLFWANPINSDAGRNKKAEPLVPNMEFTHIGSRQYDHDCQKTYLDFSDPVSLVQYSTQHATRRPARLRALLCNPAGLALLALATRTDHDFMSHELHHLLTNCFLESSPHNYKQKQDLLYRLAIFQSTLMQGLPVVTFFLAQFLPFWNEKDFFAEILELVEWVNVEDADRVTVILDTLSNIFYRAEPMEQCAILKSLTTMYMNLAYASTRPRHHFLNLQPSETTYAETLTIITGKISDMCSKGLQASPDDMRMVYSTVVTTARAARAASRAGAPPPPPRTLSLALPLLASSGAAVDALAELIMLYKDVFSIMKEKIGRNRVYKEQMKILKAFTSDFVSCFCETFLSGRKNGLIFSNLHPQLVSKLTDLIPDVNSKLSIRNHLALAPFTYIQLEAVDHIEADNKMWFETVVKQEYDNLSQFIMKTMLDLC
ncbi:unnamed protein product, partial [Brenthis ino]